MDKLISVIVPVYNVEKFLDKCISSIVNQTYKNLEIILIDDGSTDESVQICDKWQEKDNRVRLTHKENTGVSDTRNIGLEKTTGEYICFVDSDDYIEPDYIENLYKSLTENNADIASCGHIAEAYSNSVILFSNSNFVADTEETLKRLFLRNDVFPVLWGKLYKKELFDGIRFPDGKIHEDIATVYKVLAKSKITTHIDKAGYHYIQRHGSIMHKEFSKERLIVIDFLEELLEFIEKEYPNLMEYAEEFFIRQLNRHVILCKENKMKADCKNIKIKLREYIPRILKNKKMTFYFKARSVFLAYLY